VPGTFAGWLQACVVLLSNDAFSLTSASQISNLTTSAISGMRSSQLYNMPYASSLDGCAGFTGTQLNSMPSSTFAGWTDGCVAIFPPSVFTTISAVAMSNFASDIYTNGFTGPQFSALTDTVLASIPLNLLGVLSSDVINALNAHQFAVLVKASGSAFLKLWSVGQLQDYPNNKELLLLKAMVPSTIRPILSAIPTPYYSATWLELIFTNAVAIDGTMLGQFDPTTIWGITAAQAPLMTADAINVLVGSAQTVGAIQPDTMANFTCAQVQAISEAGVRNEMSDATAAAFDARSKACGSNVTILFPGHGKNGELNL